MNPIDILKNKIQELEAKINTLELQLVKANKTIKNVKNALSTVIRSL